MSYTRVKICGITRVEDAMAAVESGADALGFVFYEPSARDVSADTVRGIIQQLPAFVATVALFVNETAGVIANTVRASGVSCIQLHGDESPEFCDQVAVLTGVPVIKAIRVSADGEFFPEPPNKYLNVQAVLLDTYSTSAAGGTGHVFNWDYVPACERPVILAGGLTAENVADAIDKVKPYAVDVSGGVEQEGKKGIKDCAKIEAFIRQAKC